jgi:hypothetical protein
MSRPKKGMNDLFRATVIELKEFSSKDIRDRTGFSRSYVTNHLREMVVSKEILKGVRLNIRDCRRVIYRYNNNGGGKAP